MAQRTQWRCRLILTDNFVLVGGWKGCDERTFEIVDEKTGAIYAIPREEVVSSELRMY